MYSFLFYLELIPLQSQFLPWHSEQPKMKKLQSNTSFFCPLLCPKTSFHHWAQKNEPCRTRFSFCFAEREGFEPPEPLSSTVFKTAAIDHSAISPSVLVKNRKKCAQDETRTHTVLRPLPPQSSVYTNFTTCASSECNLFDCLFSKITF